MNLIFLDRGHVYNTRRIIARHVEGGVDLEFKSVTEASRELGIPYAHIIRGLKKGTTEHDFTFKDFQTNEFQPRAVENDGLIEFV